MMPLPPQPLLHPPVPCGATAAGPVMWLTHTAVAPDQAIQACYEALLRRPSHGAPPRRPSVAAAAAERSALQHGSQAVMGSLTPQKGTPW